MFDVQSSHARKKVKKNAEKWNLYYIKVDERTDLEVGV